MKKKIYLAKANRENLIEITGSEFYRMVSDRGIHCESELRAVRKPNMRFCSAMTKGKGS